MVNNRVVHGGCGLGKENEMDDAYHKFFGTWSFYSIDYIYVCMCVQHVSRLLEHILQNLILELILYCPKKTH